MKKESHSIADKNVMTSGCVWSKMTLFAIPIFLGNLFQQLYNTADSYIVGNYLGTTALSAVTSAGSLIFLLIGFFQGLSMGAGVVIARYIGAEDKQSIEKSVHTAVALGIVSGVLMTIIGVFFTPKILVLMGTPDNVMPSSVAYFRLYFLGSIGFVMYNTLMGILQAAGDSKHPLYYLIISSVINIVLDITLIGFFKRGVWAAALATAISQLVSAVLCFIRLLNINADYRIRVNLISFDGIMLKKIIRFGLPSAFQNSIIAFANIVVQSNINSFGEYAMAGAGAYSKVEGFAFLPITSFAMAITTFVSQNLGAGNIDRAREGARFGTTVSVIVAEIIGVFIFILAPVFISSFDKTSEVVDYGTVRARTCALFFCLLAFSHAMAALMRGLGKAIVPMVVMLICWCIIRVSILVFVGYFIHNIAVVNWVYPITWSLSSIVFAGYYLKTPLLRNKEKDHI
ncbi:MATE family efflux transporter [Butyrivibrio sp. NC3005]|uniref:MATE family efflux transporter n=1 Tax=Butyrivibrio sp. NC3005 TaxID=1280685 RepID=UPI000414D88B|nr:MATE family efflux transporter [Butyrivibrio sp. NC3005]